jgi:hypothetical protein
MEFARGDLVWARVHGHPRWPGQVSDPDRASKTASAARPSGKSLLVAFFGDGSFGWFNEAELQPFAPNYDALRKGGKTQARGRAFLSPSPVPPSDPSPVHPRPVRRPFCALLRTQRPHTTLLLAVLWSTLVRLPTGFACGLLAQHCCPCLQRQSSCSKLQRTVSCLATTTKLSITVRHPATTGRAAATDGLCMARR